MPQEELPDHPVGTDGFNSFVDFCYSYRGEIKKLSERIKLLHRVIARDRQNRFGDTVSDFDEMHANITLAYRHLEDAAMRLGKAVQAYDGGKSVYPR